MDQTFSFAHRDGKLIDLVDEEWKKDVLPNDEVSLPRELMDQSEEGDVCVNIRMNENKEEEKHWAELELDSFGVQSSGNKIK